MNDISIVDRGRGPQLSTSRITVQDLVPYFQQRYTYDQIRELMPILTVEEIATIERYIEEHRDEVAQQDQQIRERMASRWKPPETEESIRHQRLERIETARRGLRQRGQEDNGDHAAG